MSLKVVNQNVNSNYFLFRLLFQPLLSQPDGLQEAIKVLSEYVLKFEDAKLFRKYLSNILLALVSAKVPLKSVFSNSNYDMCIDSEKSNHLEYSIILALMSDHPDILQ